MKEKINWDIEKKVKTFRTFLSSSLFLDITWKALRALNSLSIMTWQQYKVQVLNSNEEFERRFLGGRCT